MKLYDAEELEKLYAQGTLDSASVPRVLLMLYDRLLLLLKSIHGCWQTQPQLAHQQLIQAHDILTHMLIMFMHSQDQAYHDLHDKHETIGRELTQLFKLPMDSAQRLSLIRSSLEMYRKAWRQNMNVKKRIERGIPPLNVNRIQS